MILVQSMPRSLNRFTEPTQAEFRNGVQANWSGAHLPPHMRPPMNYGQRLRLAREEKGLTQKALAKLVGMSASNLWELEEKGKGSAKTAQMAEVLGVRPQWLASGDGDMRENLSSAQVSLGKVPLVSSVAAGMFTEAMDLLPAGFADEWINCAVPVKEHTFALRVEGDSMEPDFPEGMILIIEPDMTAQAGDFVIAKNGDNEATFKQLTKDGGTMYLKPLNSRYPIKPLGEATVIGVVRQAIKNFR